MVCMLWQFWCWWLSLHYWELSSIALPRAESQVSSIISLDNSSRVIIFLLNNDWMNDEWITFLFLQVKLSPDGSNFKFQPTDNIFLALLQGGSVSRSQCCWFAHQSSRPMSLLCVHWHHCCRGSWVPQCTWLCVPKAHKAKRGPRLEWLIWVRFLGCTGSGKPCVKHKGKCWLFGALKPRGPSRSGGRRGWTRKRTGEKITAKLGRDMKKQEKRRRKIQKD